MAGLDNVNMTKDYSLLLLYNLNVTQSRAVRPQRV